MFINFSFVLHNHVLFCELKKNLQLCGVYVFLRKNVRLSVSIFK